MRPGWGPASWALPQREGVEGREAQLSKAQAPEIGPRAPILPGKQAGHQDTAHHLAAGPAQAVVTWVHGGYLATLSPLIIIRVPTSQVLRVSERLREVK